MSPSDIIAVIAKTNKISLGFFVVTCILLGYELYLYLKDKKGNKKPSIPVFKKGTQEPLSTHTAKPVPTPPQNLAAKPKPASMPPLIGQMSPPTMSHSPVMGKKKKKMSRGAKVTVGATAALAVLTIGIAWKLNQPSSQQAGLTSQNAKANEQLTPGASVPPGESTPSALTDVSPSPSAIASSSGKALIPTITPRPDVVDLTSGKTTSPDPALDVTASPTPTLGALASASTTTTTTTSTDSTDSTAAAEIATLPTTGGSSTEAATIAPTLPIAGTIQYSIGLLVVASVIMLASLIF